MSSTRAFRASDANLSSRGSATGLVVRCEAGAKFISCAARPESERLGFAGGWRPPPFREGPPSFGDDARTEKRRPPFGLGSRLFERTWRAGVQPISAPL